VEGGPNSDALKDPLVSGCYTPMGVTSENVATKFGITREKQDFYAYNSHMRAAKAVKEGKFKDEIVPITVNFKDKDGNVKKITVSEDEGIRPQTTLEGLSKLKPAFKKNNGTTTGIYYLLINFHI
jgi:acetyl-CoA acyltransferase 1